MKNYLKLLGIILISGMFFVSCTDDFNEKDAMEALQTVTLQIGVHNASSSDTALAGAQVKAIVDTSVVTVTTNSNGVAVIENIKIGGNVNIYVSKAGYTTVFTSINTTPGDYRQTVVSGNVYLYSLSGDNIATVKGQLTIETNITNRQKEYVSGVEVLAYNSSLGNTTRYFAGTTDASGNYSIAVPIDGDGGNTVNVYFPTIEKQRTVGRNINNIYSVETKTAVYEPGYYNVTSIDRVPSALIGIAAPPSSGTGFQLGLKAVRNSLSAAINNEGTDEAIVSGGSGYTGTETFLFAPDPDGNQAELNVSVNADGVITSVSITNNSATYSSMPAIVTSPTNGSGAIFDFRFRTQYKVYIANHGTGYLTFPQVGLDYSTSMDNTSNVKMEFDPDINDGSNPLDGDNLFYSAFISNGTIRVSDETEGDTLFTSYYTYTEPVFTYNEEDRIQAVFAASLTAISSTDSTFSDSFYTNNNGNGYDFNNPPTVTVTALAGYGSGAVVKAEVNNSGQVSDLIVMKKGSGYVRDINDYDSDNNYNESEYGYLTGFDGSNNGYGYHQSVKPGMTYIGNAYYGTGQVNE